MIQCPSNYKPPIFADNWYSWGPAPRWACPASAGNCAICTKRQSEEQTDPLRSTGAGFARGEFTDRFPSRFAVNANAGEKIGIVHSVLYTQLVKLRAGALVIGPDLLFFSRSGELGVLAFRHAIPATCPYREFAAAGGLMSYGSNSGPVPPGQHLYRSHPQGREARRYAGATG